MNIFAQARADLPAMLADGETVRVTNPDGASADLSGLFQDIGRIIDVDTGVPVSGRQVSVSLGLASLAAAGLGVPYGVSDSNGWPWRIDMTAPDGSARHYKVDRRDLDEPAGIVVCFLEPYDTKST